MVGTFEEKDINVQIYSDNSIELNSELRFFGEQTPLKYFSPVNIDKNWLTRGQKIYSISENNQFYCIAHLFWSFAEKYNISESH